MKLVSDPLTSSERAVMAAAELDEADHIKTENAKVIRQIEEYNRSEGHLNLKDGIPCKHCMNRGDFLEKFENADGYIEARVRPCPYCSNQRKAHNESSEAAYLMRALGLEREDEKMFVRFLDGWGIESDMKDEDQKVLSDHKKSLLYGFAVFFYLVRYSYNQYLSHEKKN